MSQAEIHELLEKNPDRLFTPDELATQLKVSRSTAMANACKLRKRGIVEQLYVPMKGATYKLKRKSRNEAL